MAVGCLGPAEPGRLQVVCFWELCGNCSRQSHSAAGHYPAAMFLGVCPAGGLSFVAARWSSDFGLDYLELVTVGNALNSDGCSR